MHLMELVPSQMERRVSGGRHTSEEQCLKAKGKAYP
jgi:hypothetical protein